MINERQKTEFYNGFIEALLWSTGGEPDYSEAPDGYSTKCPSDGDWLFVYPGGYGWGDYHKTEREAIIAAWEDSGEEPPTLDSLDGYELAPTTARWLREYCDAWCDTNTELLNQYARRRDGRTDGCATVWEHAGHDFALTANGHGAGFWDRGLGELGDALTAAATRDYRQPPGGYMPSFDRFLKGWILWRDHGPLTPIIAEATRQAAINAAWLHSEKTPPERPDPVFSAYIGDDGLVYVEGFEL